MVVPILKPPIAPVVAVIVPEIVAFVAIISPAGLTLNGADPKVAFPKYIPLESALKIEFPVPMLIVPPVKAPVKLPLAAERDPLNVPDPLIVRFVPSHNRP